MWLLRTTKLRLVQYLTMHLLLKKVYAEARTESKSYSKMKSSVFRLDDSFQELAEYKGIDLIDDCQAKLPLTYGFISNTASKKSQKTSISKTIVALSLVAMLDPEVKVCV